MKKEMRANPTADSRESFFNIMCGTGIFARLFCPAVLFGRDARKYGVVNRSLFFGMLAKIKTDSEKPLATADAFVSYCLGFVNI